jgi:acetyl-CoA carboxylase biotin carboxylase subunit
MSKKHMLKILIANRAEIALRIQRTCNRMGIACAVTVSEADKKSYFAEAADEVALIKGFTAKDSYLNIESILKAARRHKCNAIHPGYGFLSENADFAKKVVKSGLIFIGPKPECILALGDKGKARKVAESCGVPVTPGTAPGLSDTALLKEAKKMDFPLLIKAVAGGGGRGMRVINDLEELKSALPGARSEAKKNFLDSRVYLEKYINKPRHVEVQILGDNWGNALHFGTRDCSTQRRHQKLIEEAPAPYLTQRLRQDLHEAALRIVHKVKYNSVGTAEFLVEGDKFYFLEMNTRIQVEHPVTEEITGYDLIKLQIETALGEKLEVKQSHIKFKGHSIEFRINAEDSRDNFKPLTGKIKEIEVPKNKNLRLECGFTKDDEISPYYDGLVGKIIVNGANRKEAIRNSIDLLDKVKIEGIVTTLDFHKWALKQKQFQNSTFDIAFIGREFSAKSFLTQDARLLVDKGHKGRDYSEIINYLSKKSKYRYKIEVIHLKDKTFLFIPHNSQGKKAKEEYCRRSNSYNAAYNSLKDEVLERENPKKIF